MAKEQDNFIMVPLPRLPIERSNDGNRDINRHLPEAEHEIGKRKT